MTCKEDAKKDFTKPSLRNFDSWVAEAVNAPQEEKEPFCPFGSKTFGGGCCDVAYTDHCFHCEYAMEAYKQRLTDKYWDGLPFPGK